MGTKVTTILILLVGIFFSAQTYSADVTPEWGTIQSALLSTGQLNVSGELLYQMPANPPQERQYEKFTLKFDRPTRRLRLSYSRFMGLEERVDIEAWGTLDCLNLLRTDHQTADIYTAEEKNCQTTQALYSLMSTGTGVPSAPLDVLKGEIDGELLTRFVGNPQQDISIKKQSGHAVVHIASTSPISHFETRFWLTPNETALTNVEIRDGNLSRTRINYVHSNVPLKDADFAYIPDPVSTALAKFASSRNQDRTELQALADNGNKAAKAALLMSSETLAGAMMGVVGDSGWETLDQLQALGVASAYTIEGQILGRMPEKALPTKFKSWTPEQRKQRASELVVEGAKRCDHQALVELNQGFDLLRPTKDSQKEFAAIKEDCNSTSASAEAKRALARFIDPWP